MVICSSKNVPLNYSLFEGYLECSLISRFLKKEEKFIVSVKVKQP